MNRALQHDRQRQQFHLDSSAGRAELDYQQQANTLTVLSTRVPTASRGQGLAAQLTAAVIEYCRSEGLALRPSCSYTQTYLRRHPQQGLTILD